VLLGLAVLLGWLLRYLPGPAHDVAAVVVFALRGLWRVLAALVGAVT
jgi:hypothetical protein